MRSTDTIAKWRNAMHSRRVEKYRAAFEYFGNRAGTAALARYLGMNPTSFARSLRELASLGVIRKTGEKDTGSPGKPEYQWTWVEV